MYVYNFYGKGSEPFPVLWLSNVMGFGGVVGTVSSGHLDRLEKVAI